MRLHIVNSFNARRSLQLKDFFWPMTMNQCNNDPASRDDLCPWVACDADSECSTFLCYEGQCREPLNPLIKFAVVTISIALLFIVFGIVYLTCHTRRI